MDDKLWDAIKIGFDIVKSGVLKRTDGDGFILYRAGTIIRIDIKMEE